MFNVSTKQVSCVNAVASVGRRDLLRRHTRLQACGYETSIPPSLSTFTKTSATPAINEDNLLILTKDNLAGE